MAWCITCDNLCLFSWKGRPNLADAVSSSSVNLGAAALHQGLGNTVVAQDEEADLAGCKVWLPVPWRFDISGLWLWLIGGSSAAKSTLISE